MIGLHHLVENGFPPGRHRDCRLAVTALMFVLLAAACASKDIGTLISNPVVNDMFKLNRPPADHRYYYYGWIGEPDAVVGIHPEYTLESGLWFEVDLNQFPMQLLVDRMTRREPTNFFGAVLKDPAGNRMGIWFSDSPGASIKMAGEKRIAYIRPYPRRIERDDEDIRRPFGIGGGIGIRR